MIRVIVGSNSPLKVEAVKAAVDHLALHAEVSGRHVPSGVSAQPYGRQETMNGALGRALAAQLLDPEAYAIGIENGLVTRDDITHDIGIVVVLTPDIGLVSLESEGVRVPVEIVQAAKAAVWTKTAGFIESQRSHCDPADPHRVWSSGRTDRKTLLTETVRRALHNAITGEKERTREEHP